MNKTKKKIFTIKNYKSITHKVLGNESKIKLLKEKYIKIKKKIDIKKYGDEKKKINIISSTVPHAGFEYSGLHALFIIDEILKYDSKNITILWFKHNPNKIEEHSLENVRKLVQILNPNTKIHDIMISNATKFEDISSKIKGGILISTDFSHHNYGNHSNMKNVWLNDKKYLSKKNLLTNNTGLIKPCGNNPLRIFKNLVEKNNLSVKLLCYSNSQENEKWWGPLNNKPFKGVTYASLISFYYKKNWLFNLDSKLLAYSHLKWVESFLKSINNRINNGLYWSPLKILKGSCFITVSDIHDNTLSCFGNWEDTDNNILNCMKKASLKVKTSSWNNKEPINLNNLKNNYKITITLIEPIQNWKKVDKIKKKNKGYVYLKNNKVGMTYLPSVWKSFKLKSNFFKKLKKKQTDNYPNDNYSNLNSWELFCYNSISWNLSSL